MRCRFDLFPSDGGYSVRLTLDDGSSEVAPFRFDFTAESRLREVIAKIDEGTCAVTDLLDAGIGLWSALCPAELVPLFNSAKAASTNDVLGIALNIPLIPELDALPWEAMYDEQAGRFLGCNPDVALYRVPPADTPPAAPRSANAGRVRVLAVVPERSSLQVPYELSALRDLETYGVETRLLDQKVTVKRLSETVSQASFDVLHYIGHGDFDDGGVSIRLNDTIPAPDRQDIYLDATRFSTLFENRGIQLAVMNCCLSAPSVSRRLAGLGPQLARTARIAAVVAMRYEIDDSIAILFAGEFYRELFGGSRPGRVDVAMQSARKILLQYARSDTIRGCITPILYIAPGREQLFELPERAPVKPPPDEQPGEQEITEVNEVHVQLPHKLVSALRGRRLIPVIGSEIHSYCQVRREAAAPTLRQLVAELLLQWDYPEAEELNFGERAGEGFISMVLPRFFQHAELARERAEIIAAIESICAARRASPLLDQIATWDVPGMIYTHIDGLMAAALGKRNATRVMNVLEQEAEAITSAVGRHVNVVDDRRDALLLVNLRGSLNDPKSLILTEADHEGLSDRLAIEGGELGDLLTGDGIGRTVVFIGVHPRDPVVRQLCKTHLSDKGSVGRIEGKLRALTNKRVAKFFVVPRMSAVDEAVWQEYDIQWIQADPAAVVAAMTAELAEGRR
jgi:hypothetical protein